MTNEQRIAAAARAMCEADSLAPAPDAPIMWNMKPAKAWEARVPLVRVVLQTVYPELHPVPGEQPTHWLAPWEGTEEMCVAAENVPEGDSYHYAAPRHQWPAMRDAYLAEPLKP